MPVFKLANIIIILVSASGNVFKKSIISIFSKNALFANNQHYVKLDCLSHAPSSKKFSIIKNLLSEQLNN